MYSVCAILPAKAVFEMCRAWR